MVSLNILDDIGFNNISLLKTEEIPFDFSFRKYCEENFCGSYGRNYACPPDCGTPEEMKQKLTVFPYAIVFQTICEIKDFNDNNEIKSAKSHHKKLMKEAIKRLQEEGHKGIAAMAGCCTTCETCGKIKGFPCPSPEEAYSCMSAYCINVEQLSAKLGFEYWFKGQKAGFFGIYAFE